MHIKQYDHNKIICGCDEAGRGALAGPVVASAVILPKKFHHKELNDSKKLSHKKRTELSNFIKNNSLFWSVGIIDVEIIDKINILNASIKAMHLAITKNIAEMKFKPDLLLIDGNKFHPYNQIRHKCVIKGDSKYSSIAAASILAKTFRDNLMIKLDKEHPLYNWKKNKGYPTIEHKKKLIDFGITKHHRKSFKLLPKQYRFQF